MRYMLVIVNRYHTMSLRANQLPVLPCGVLFNSPSSDLTDWAARGQRDARCALMLLVKDHRPGTFVVKNHRPGTFIVKIAGLGHVFACARVPRP